MAKLPPRKIGLLDDQQPEFFVRRDADIQISLVNDLAIAGEKPPIPGYAPLDAIDDKIAARPGEVIKGNLLANDHPADKPVIHIDDPKPQIVSFEYQGKVYNFADINQFAPGPKSILIETTAGNLTVSDNGDYKFVASNVAFFQEGGFLNDKLTYTIEQNGQKDTAVIDLVVGGKIIPTYAPLDAVDDKIATHPGEVIKGNLLANDHSAEKPVNRIDDPKPQIISFEYQGKVYNLDSLKMQSGEHGRFATVETNAGKLTVHEDGYYTFEAANVAWRGGVGFLSDKLTYTIEQGGQKDTAVVNITVGDLGPLPTKTEAHNDIIQVPSFIIGGAYFEKTSISRPPVSGNILANDTLESGSKLASLNYEGKMYSFDKPSGIDAVGKFLMIDTANGGMKIYQSGAYTYAVDEGFREAGTERIEYVLSGPNNGSRGEITIDIGAVIYGMGTIGPHSNTGNQETVDEVFVTMAAVSGEDGSSIDQDGFEVVLAGPCPGLNDVPDRFIALSDLLPEHNSLDSLLPASLAVEPQAEVKMVAVASHAIDMQVMNDILKTDDDTSAV